MGSMITPSKDEVYCTLLTTDSYLIGAQVLARALRDGGARRDLAVLYTEEDVTKETIEELKKMYDHVIRVERICNPDLTKLNIMRRPDLASTFTKITLWQQTQFRKIVYLDADTLPLRIPEELFDLEVYFAASPELGFPDCFNSGMMVLKPSQETFTSLRKLAAEGSSFDGGDQGLLNLQFPNFHKLSFLYNMELNRVYRLYMPAIFQFRERWSVVHFIGKDKPWNLKRGTPPYDDSEYSKLYAQMVERWWEVHDKMEDKNTS